MAKKQKKMSKKEAEMAAMAMKEALDKRQMASPIGSSSDTRKTINDQDEWQDIQQDWANQQAQRAKAHMLKFFDVDDQMPLSRHLLLVAIVSFIALFLFWANLATLDEVTHGQGKIVPSSEVKALQSLEPGIVEEFLVHEGEEVKKGQVIVRLSDIDASSDLGANKARYLGLLASVTRLQAEAEGRSTVDFPDEVMKGAPSSVTEELNTFRANQQQVQGQINIFQQQLSQREQELRELSTRISDTRGVIRLQDQEKDMVEPLVARGSAPRMELLQLERSIKEKTTELNGYLSSRPRIQSSINEAQARITDIKNSAQAQAQVELSAKLIEMNELKERLSSLTERKARTEIKSPVDGFIQELTINTIGGVVRAGEDLVKIVPKDDQLIVEAEIRPSDRAFVYPGQPAVIKLTAYDFAIYGGLDGEVMNISVDTFEDEKGDTYYRVRLKTHETELKRKDEVLPITVGMVANVDILTGQKTVMQYLLKPFTKTLQTAMRER